MSIDPIHVWTCGPRGGMFACQAAALSHCYTITNDHRRQKELLPLINGAVRYTGPRGRRHGTRLVAYIGTRDQLSMLGILVDELGANLRKVR